MSIIIITGKDGSGKTTLTSELARSSLLSGKKVFSNFKLFPEQMKLKKTWTYKEVSFENSTGLSEKIKLSDIEGLISNEEDRNNPAIKILYWFHYGDWLWFKDGIVLCDEGVSYFDSHMWEKLPRSMRLRFTQHRKDKIDLVFNFPHYSFVDKTLRVWCRRWINLELWIGSPRFKDSWIPRIARLHEYDLQTLNRCENLGLDPFNIDKEMAEKWNIEPNVSAKYWIDGGILWKFGWWNKKIHWYDSGSKVGESRPEPLTHTERTCITCGKIVTSHF